MTMLALTGMRSAELRVSEYAAGQVGGVFVDEAEQGRVQELSRGRELPSISRW
jgi:hypothetical protein